MSWTPMRKRRPDKCHKCSRIRPVYGRGLCGGCYSVERKNGRLEDWQPVNTVTPIQDVIEEIEWLTGMGVRLEDVPARLGTTLEALGRRLMRHGHEDLGRPMVNLAYRARSKRRVML